jgi:hypothetical protein
MKITKLVPWLVEGQECHLGLDLASRTDLAAMAIVFPSRDTETGRSTYAVFARCYLNEAAVAEARNPSYPGWAATGHLVVTKGNETDFDEIESDVRQICSRFNVVSAGYDPWQSAQMSQRLRGEGVPARVPGDQKELQPRDYRTRRSDAREQAAARRQPRAHVVHRQCRRQGGQTRQPVSDQEQAGSENRCSDCPDDGDRPCDGGRRTSEGSGWISF